MTNNLTTSGSIRIKLHISSSEYESINIEEKMVAEGGKNCLEQFFMSNSEPEG